MVDNKRLIESILLGIADIKRSKLPTHGYVNEALVQIDDMVWDLVDNIGEDE